VSKLFAMAGVFLSDKLWGRLESVLAVRRLRTVGHARMPAAICLLLGMASVLLATGCGASGVDVTDASVRISTGSTSGAGQSQLYRVPSGSMEPTLPIGTRVLVKKEPLTVGSIVVYHPPEGALEQECGPKPHVLTPGGAACDAPVPQETKLELIKRIVAGPGDEIFVREGHIYRKAKGVGKYIRESDPYIRACGGVPECNFPIPIKISAGHWFLMGDNRGESDDSRFWGPVPTAWIVGVATNFVL
jgi:signal peptidase I